MFDLRGVRSIATCSAWAWASRASTTRGRDSCRTGAAAGGPAPAAAASTVQEGERPADGRPHQSRSQGLRRTDRAGQRGTVHVFADQVPVGGGLLRAVADHATRARARRHRAEPGLRRRLRRHLRGARHEQAPARAAARAGDRRQGRGGARHAGLRRAGCGRRAGRGSGSTRRRTSSAAVRPLPAGAAARARARPWT